MKKLNRNNANIKKILNKKVAIVCDSKEKELDFRRWAKQYINAVDEDYVYTNCGNGICITLEYGGLKWDYIKYFLEDNYSIYEWEIAEEEKTYTIKDVVENEGKIYRTTTNDCIYKYDKNFLYYKDIRKLSDDWRTTELTLGEMIRLKFKFIEYKPEPKISAFKIITKEILKSCLPQKTYTIKDVVENKGKVYKCISDWNNGVLYKYIDDVLYATYNRIEWKKSLVALRKLLKYEFIEYKPEPKEITFEEALKEMETKVCRCLFSNRHITICGTQFIDASNAENTKLALPEIKGEWVVIEE